MIEARDTGKRLGDLFHGFYPAERQEIEAAGQNLPDVTAAGSANVKGAYVELIAATAFDAHAIEVIVTKNNSINVMDVLIDLATGAAASEVVFLNNLLVSFGSTIIGVEKAIIPFYVKAGSRIAARLQSTNLGAVARVGVRLIETDAYAGGPFKKITSYGPNTSDSGGVQVDPGAVGSTKGAWTEITAVTTDPIRWLVVSLGNRANAALVAASSGRLDIGVGAGGAEAVIVPDIPIRSLSVEDCHRPSLSGAYPVKIRAGQRLAARMSINTTDATDRLADVALYGVC